MKLPSLATLHPTSCSQITRSDDSPNCTPPGLARLPCTICLAVAEPKRLIIDRPGGSTLSFCLRLLGGFSFASFGGDGSSELSQRCAAELRRLGPKPGAARPPPPPEEEGAAAAIEDEGWAWMAGAARGAGGGGSSRAEERTASRWKDGGSRAIGVGSFLLISSGARGGGA